jgi:hypothetical protein
MQTLDAMLGVYHYSYLDRRIRIEKQIPTNSTAGRQKTDQGMHTIHTCMSLLSHASHASHTSHTSQDSHDFHAAHASRTISLET